VHAKAEVRKGRKTLLIGGNVSTEVHAAHFAYLAHQHHVYHSHGSVDSPGRMLLSLEGADGAAAMFTVAPVDGDADALVFEAHRVALRAPPDRSVTPSNALALHREVQSDLTMADVARVRLYMNYKQASPSPGAIGCWIAFGVQEVGILALEAIAMAALSETGFTEELTAQTVLVDSIMETSESLLREYIFGMVFWTLSQDVSAVKAALRASDEASAVVDDIEGDTESAITTAYERSLEAEGHAAGPVVALVAGFASSLVDVLLNLLKMCGVHVDPNDEGLTKLVSAVLTEFVVVLVDPLAELAKTGAVLLCLVEGACWMQDWEEYDFWIVPLWKLIHRTEAEPRCKYKLFSSDGCGT